jgi:anti-sigma factor RsiW
MPMSCDEAIEFLPWLLNGTLEARERDEVRQHLATCERCRAALNDTREAWTVFSQHLSSETLVALAYGEPPEGMEAAVAERHLASCPECAAELELARTSRGLEEDDKITLFPGARSPRTQEHGGGRRSFAALAAGLAAAVAFSGWFYELRQANDLSARLARKTAPIEAPPAVPVPSPGGGVAGRQLAELREQIQQSRQAQEQLSQQLDQEKTQVEALRSTVLQPQINAWMGTAAQDVVRDGSAAESQNDVLPSDQPATLTLNTESAKALREIEVRDSHGKTLFSAPGLREKDLQYQVFFPKGFLAPGRYTVQLYETVNGRRMPREKYQIQVR